MTISAMSLNLFLLVFMRISGAVIFNPLLGRNNVPVTLRGALSLIIAFVVFSTVNSPSTVAGGVVQLIVQCVFELFIGFIIGTVVNIFFAVVLIAGEIIDTQMGLSMARYYDPNSGVSMPILGSYFNALMVLVFFASNAHLSLLTLTADSFKLIPPGTVGFAPKAAQYMVMLGKDMMEFGLRMAIPVLAVEMVCIVAIGLLMRAVPQINIFSVGIQIQAIVGIIIVAISVPVIVPMCSRLSTLIVEKSVVLVRMLVNS
ncbi:MAG TPA: flagellar biosynthetic protein FliR [Clostridia bacterium]|nr:flagellar biosynthetic protein FliR [Clostridia bacterium]